MYEVLSGTHFHLADVVDKAHHAQKRKVLSSAYAIKNLQDWEYKIADKIARLVKRFDAACTEPLKSPHAVDPADLTIDYRAQTNFFTMDAIADIGLNQSLGFTDAADDTTVSEALDGTLTNVHYRDCIHSLLTAQSHLVWSYQFYPWLVQISKLLPSYRRMWRLGQAYDGIVLHQAKKRFQRYLAGEKLDDFFQALMESKDGSAHNLEWGEIVAEISIMCECHHPLATDCQIKSLSLCPSECRLGVHCHCNQQCAVPASKTPRGIGKIATGAG